MCVCMCMCMCRTCTCTRECVPELGNVRVVVAYVIIYFTCVPLLPRTCLLLAATLLGPTGRFYKVYRQRAAPAAPGPGNGGKCVSHSRPGPQDVHASHEAPLSPRTPDPADLECHTQNRSTADGGAIPSSTQRSPGGDTRTKVPGWRGRTPPGGGRQPTATPGRDPPRARRDKAPT